MKQVLDILNKIKPHIDYENEQHLVDDNLFDSFDIITLISEINSLYGINIKLSDLSRDILNSYNNFSDYVNKQINK